MALRCRARRPRLSRVLLVESWYGGSHRAWADGLAAHSRHEVRIVGLPSERWRWRQQGGAVTLARAVVESAAEHHPDVVVVSGPLDVAQLVGLCDLGDVPTVVYQHESQLLYPSTGNEAQRRQASLTDWISWVAADEVWFNSDTHRRGVLGALPDFVRRLEDPAHEAFLEPVLRRFRTMPLGLDLSGIEAGSSGVGASGIDMGSAASAAAWSRPLIVWPHRWEQDKDPLAFGRALERLERSGLDFGLVLAGCVPLEGPDLRQALRDRFDARVVACGPFDRATYLTWLGRSDIVVSCAHHDFFGVGVAEAVAAGCRPVVPFGLAYQEVLGDEACGYERGAFGSALEAAVRAWHAGARAAERHGTAVQRLSWPQVVDGYDAALDRVGRARPH